MVAPKLSSSNRLRMRRQQPEATTGGNSYYMVLAVKILLVLVILLWLPPLVISKKKRKGRTSEQHLHFQRMNCEMECLSLQHDHDHDMQSMQQVPPEESMNCILECLSPKCFQDIYQELLEPGEVDIERYLRFETRIKLEWMEERKQQRAGAADDTTG